MEIYLLSNEIHTDIAVPLRNKVFDWETFLDASQFKSRPVEWLEIGWGDRQFYFEMPTWDKFTLKLALDALLLPDAAVMHVNYLDMHPKDYLSAKKVRISYATYEKLVTALKGSFLLKDDKPIILPGKAYTSTDNFYEAHESFSLIRTCNVWTSDALGKAGIKHPLWSPTKYGLQLMW